MLNKPRNSTVATLEPPTHLPYPERITWPITTPDGADRRFRRKLLAPLSFRLGKRVARNYIDRFGRGGLRAANLGLLKEVGPLESKSPLDLLLGAGDEEIRSWAKQKATRCLRILSQPPRPLMESVCRFAGIEPPYSHYCETAAIARMTCPYWWQRRVRRIVARRFEASSIRAGLVNIRCGRYASDDTVIRRVEKKRRDHDLLAALLATNELGDEFTLAELQDHSLSNPRIRRAELMTRLSGFENFANESAHVGEFYTLTVPSRMHARLNTSGEENPNYDGTTPSQAQKHLCDLWACFRAAIHRRSIEMYGFRIAEPHHDGTPHWHLLLFMAPEHTELVRALLRKYALQVDPDEPGASEHRFRAMRIDPRKGTATGYVAKYVSKNIDGYGLADEEGDPNPAEAAVRVDAWASIWNIRQFQQIGGPPVGPWREFRRITERLVGHMEAARVAADAGDWAEYMRAYNNAKSEGTVIRTAHIWSDKPGRYGEPVGDCVVGVTDGAVVATSRIHDWMISFAPAPCALDPWSSVNNCTGIKGSSGQKC